MKKKNKSIQQKKSSSKKLKNKPGYHSSGYHWGYHSDLKSVNHLINS